MALLGREQGKDAYLSPLPDLRLLVGLEAKEEEDGTMSTRQVTRRRYKAITRIQVDLGDEGYISGYWCKVIGRAGGFLLVEDRNGDRFDGYFNHAPRWRRPQ